MKKGKKIFAIFAGINKQPYGDSQLLDTYWIIYDDKTFNQCACLANGPILFSEGTYSLSDGRTLIGGENSYYLCLKSEASRKCRKRRKNVEINTQTRMVSEILTST